MTVWVSFGWTHAAQKEPKAEHVELLFLMTRSAPSDIKVIGCGILGILGQQPKMAPLLNVSLSFFVI